MNSSIRQAKKDQATAESYLQAENFVKAVEYYGASWAAANLALLLADNKITPAVTITTPANGTYINTPIITVSGIIDDVAAYSISNVTLTINGNSFIVPLSGGRFTQQVQLIEGTNDIKVTAKDTCNNKGTASSRIFLDSIDPAITISGVSDGAYYNSSVQPIVSIVEANPGSSLILLDGASYSGNIVSGEGAHSLHAEVTDLAGNTAKADVSFIIDNTHPVTLLYGVQANGYLGKTALIDGGMADANPGNLSLRIDGVEVSTQLPYLWNTSNYQDGDHALELFAVDKAMNTGSTTVPVIVDNTQPTVKLLIPENGSLSPSSLIKFLWSGSDNYGILFYQLFLDNSPMVNTTDTSCTMDGLSDGSHQAIVKAYDYANNTATDSTNFIVDATPPSINISNVEEGKCYCYDVTPDVNVSDANLNFSTMALNGMTYSGECISGEGNYSLYVYAEDLAGNNAAKTVNFTIYKTPPSLSVQELTINPTLKLPVYNLTGSVDVNATLTVNGAVIAHDGRFNYSTNVTEGVNYFTVTATGPAGNTVTWNKVRLVDADMLPDFYEINYTHTDPLNNDTDGNGVPDDQEDPDHDGLTNIVEYVFGTDPWSGDSDVDGLPDLFELESSFTSPLKADTDGNGVNDANEDYDRDGLSSLREYRAGTLPYVLDSDGDVIGDRFEVDVLSTSPVSKDSDGDGLDDYSEFKLGTDPNYGDSNGDGVLDSVETHGFKDPLGLHTYTSEPNDPDTDGDGLRDGEEAGELLSSQQCGCYYNVISDPREIDSDDDGLDDPDELGWGTNPLNPYSDNDRLTDGEEVLGWYDFSKCLPDGTQVYEHVYFGTDPLDSDTDHDGYDDYVETKGNAVIVYKEDVNSANTRFETIYVYDPLIKETHVNWYTALWNGFISYSVDSPYANNYYYIMGAEYSANLATFVCLIPLVSYAGTSYEYTPAVIEEEAPVTNEAEIAVAEDIAIARKGGFKNAKLAAAERSGANAEVIRNTIIGEIGKSAYDDLIGYGVTEGTLKTLVEVIGKERVIRLNEIFREYEVKPTRIQFINEQIGENINDEGLVKTRVTIDLKKMTMEDRTPAQIQGTLSNVEGAYSELQCKLSNAEPGGEWVIDISHVNAQGTDMAQLYNGKLTYYEAKSGYVSQSDFVGKTKIFYSDAQGNLKYNAEASINNLAKSLEKQKGLSYKDARAVAEQDWEENSHVQVINVNNENSVNICNNLQQKIGDYVDYEYKSKAGPNANTMMRGKVQIVYQPTNV
jgi:hypothetical protein